MSDHRDAFDFKAHKDEERAEVTLCLASPPKRSDKPGEDFLNRLLDAAGPDGWRWSVLQIVKPDDDTPPENGKEVVAALNILIERATDARERILSVDHAYADDLDRWGLEVAFKSVQTAADALSYEDEDDDEDEDEED
jgi:hypothetical protein